jgi:mRNA-degrading endonuclease RelE of RelBE toxin-antitoxin system
MTASPRRATSSKSCIFLVIDGCLLHKHRKTSAQELERHIQERIVDKVRFFADQPDPLQFAEPLTGYDAYRFRVGDFRITFELEDDTVRILSIRRRDEAYR